MIQIEIKKLQPIMEGIVGDKVGKEVAIGD
jgi:hypothetical protein